jgi:uncharacterized protein YndB with AHSA1/START domain
MKNKTSIIAELGKQELFIIREFEAPRELVFRALNEPEMLKEWLGPRDLTLEIEKFEGRSGGSYRFINCNATGTRYCFNGVIHEVTAPERIIRTFEFEGLPERGHVSLETATFEVLPKERTKLIIHSVFKSVEDRDGMIKSGMERGVVDSHERLDELFEKQRNNS